jgi:GT2 family glycosyltransferase
MISNESHSLPKVTAVISTHDRRAELKRTLTALTSEAHIPMQIVVVDNGSTDGTGEMLQKDFPCVRSLRQAENLPLRGYNTGFAMVKTPYTWVMDDDATPTDGTLEAMVGVLESSPTLAAAAGNSVRADGSSEWSPLSLPDFTPHWYNLIGCGFLVRTETLARCHGYCENFQLYYNDLDLALRILATGNGIAFSRHWVVRHLPAASATRNRRKNLLMLRNFLFTVRNHFTGLQVWNLVVPHTAKYLGPAIKDAGLREALDALTCGLTTKSGRDTNTMTDCCAARQFFENYALSAWMRRMWRKGVRFVGQRHRHASPSNMCDDSKND